MYKLYYTKDAKKDYQRIEKSIIKEKVKGLLEIIANNPFEDPPPFKKLKGAYIGAYSRRITLQHRLFYEVDKIGKRIKILRMWSHYGDN